MARNSGPTTRDLGLRGAGAGKGDAPRNTGAKFRENFPDTLTGIVPGLRSVGLGRSRKVYAAQPVTRFGAAPHVAQHFEEFS